MAGNSKQPLPHDKLTNPESGLKTLFDYSSGIAANESRNPVDLLNLTMSMLHDWHIQLAPRLEFDNFLQNIQRRGDLAQVQGYLQEFRKAYVEDADLAQVKAPEP